MSWTGPSPVHLVVFLRLNDLESAVGSRTAGQRKSNRTGSGLSGWLRRSSALTWSSITQPTLRGIAALGRPSDIFGTTLTIPSVFATGLCCDVIPCTQYGESPRRGVCGRGRAGRLQGWGFQGFLDLGTPEMFRSTDDNRPAKSLHMAWRIANLCASNRFCCGRPTMSSRIRGPSR